MALIACPNCGKRITDRMEICPHCKTVLKQENTTPHITKAGILSGSKKRILRVAVATAESFIFTRLLAIVLGAFCGSYFGENVKRAFLDGSRAFQSRMLVILAIGLIALCILPIVLEKAAKVKIKTSAMAVSVMLAFVFGLSYASGSTAYRIMKAARDIHGYTIVPVEVQPYAVIVPFFYAVTTPIYQGMFYVLNQSIHNKKGYISQAVFAGIALVLTVILAIPGIALLGMGPGGAGLAGALASLITLVPAAIWKK